LYYSTWIAAYSNTIAVYSTWIAAYSNMVVVYCTPIAAYGNTTAIYSTAVAVDSSFIAASMLYLIKFRMQEIVVLGEVFSDRT
jgi:hypothetical protein